MPKLPRAPLQEAIFEIRWELEIDPSGDQQLDTGYALAQGKLQEIVRKHFPVYKRRVPHGIPDQLLQYQTVNQFWSGEDTWPVLQLGPGIFTVNDTDKNYDWGNSYLPLIANALDWIHSAYDGRLMIKVASLRYIDSVTLKDYDFDGEWQVFIDKHFNFNFVNNFNPRGTLKRVHFDQYFEMEEESTLNISMSNGKYRKTDQDALIWQTAVIKAAKFEKDTLLSWVEKAHTVTSDLFKEMTKPHFYASFQ